MFIYFGNYERRDYSTFKSLAPNDTPISFFWLGGIGIDLVDFEIIFA